MALEEAQPKQHEIHEAIKEGNFKLAEQLIEEHPKLIYSQDEDDRTPLHWACSKNNYNLVKFILDHTPKDTDIDNYTDLSGWSPLHITASLGNVDILKLLMSHDPQPDINQLTNQGTTLLHLAISKDHLPFVDVLLDEYGANARKKDKNGYTPLHRAAALGSMGMTKAVVEKGKNVNVNAKDNDGWTALHHALAEGKGDVAVYLVRQAHADPEVVNEEGLKPIQVSVDEKVARYFKENIE